MPVGSLSFCPKIVYNGITVALKYPPIPPVPGSQSTGGSDMSGAGIMAAFEVLRYQTLNVTLRFTESEINSVLGWLEWAQNANTFSYWMDKNDATSAHTCYLVTPKMGDQILPVRDSTQIGWYTLDVEIRDTTNTRFNYPITGL